MERLQIGGTLVERSPGYVRTILPSGRVVAAVPHASAEYRETALRLGYQDQPGETAEEALNAAHDLVHVMVSLLRGEPVCPVLDAVSRGDSWEGAAERERLVLRVQAVVMGGWAE